MMYVVACRFWRLVVACCLSPDVWWRTMPCGDGVLGGGASYSLRSPNQPPTLPAHPYIPARIAALHCGGLLLAHCWLFPVWIFPVQAHTGSHGQG